MDFELTASMMCANYGNLEKEVMDLNEGGIDSFHIDIMDGRYVPNFAMSLNDMKYIAGATGKPLDVHLMIEHPNNCINLFLNNLRKGDTVYIHPEAEYHPSTTLQNHQCRYDSGHCHQSGDIGGDSDGDAAHCKKGSGHVCESRQCGTDVSALCGQEDHKAACTERGHGL